MKTVIRHMEQSDLPDLLEILSHRSVVENSSQVPYLSYDQVKKMWGEPNTHALVAELENRVIGQMSLFLINKPREKHTASLAISVHPDFHGKGVGKQLMEVAIDQADNWLNLIRVELQVYSDNEKAINLYKKFGFETEGEQKFKNFKGGKYVNMLLMARIHPNFEKSPQASV